VPLLDRLLAPVTVGVYNVAGQRVRVLMREVTAPGSYKVEWDGRNGAGKNVAGGVYFYKVQVGEETQVGKMTLVK
jgi:flagellar hook assembly protein FlgD